MTSLYNRATPSQQRILRIVEGAVKNTCDAHAADVRLPPRFARSVAKRAAGTLSAQWADVLAAKAPSGKARKAQLSTASEPNDAGTVSNASVAANRLERRGRVTSHLVERRDPIRILEKQIFSQMKQIKISGNIAKADAWIEVLRMIAKIKEG
jgi:hypothetical protein